MCEAVKNCIELQIDLPMKAKLQAGFTLVELIVVIVILGVLAAVALPKFIDLAGDAKVAVVQSLAGSVQSAAVIATAKCAISAATCDSATPFTGTYNRVVQDGKTYYFHRGSPTAWGDPSFSGSGGITDWIDYSGFTRAPYVSPSFAVDITLDNAKDPTNCKVTYLFKNPNSSGVTEVRSITSGC